MTRTYTAAVVGTGGIANAHAQAIADTAGRVVLTHAVDVDRARAEEFAQTWGPTAGAGTAPSASTDLAEVLAETAAAGTPLDLVHVCTPPQSHFALAAQVLRAGVDVLLEKPPTLSLAELDELIALEGQTGAHVSVVFQHRFGSGALRLKALLDDPASPLGRPLVAVCHTLWYRDAEYFAAPWRGRWDTEGGGPTMGHGIHQMDLLLATLGPWAEVTAVAGRQARETDTEDVSAAVVRFDDGAIASVVSSVVSPRQTSQLRFDLEHATVDLEHLYGYTDDSWSLTPAPGHEDLAALWVNDPGSAVSSHSSQLAAIVDALDAGQAPPVTATDARLTVELVAALYASAFTGQPVRRGEIDAHHPFMASMEGTGAPWARETAGDGARTSTGVDGTPGAPGTPTPSTPSSQSTPSHQSTSSSPSTARTPSEETR